MLERGLYRRSSPHFFKSKTNITVHTSKKEKAKALSNYHMLFTTQILYSTFLKGFILKHWFLSHITFANTKREINKKVKLFLKLYGETAFCIRVADIHYISHNIILCSIKNTGSAAFL